LFLLLFLFLSFLDLAMPKFSFYPSPLTPSPAQNVTLAAFRGVHNTLKEFNWITETPKPKPTKSPKVASIAQPESPHTPQMKPSSIRSAVAREGKSSIWIEKEIVQQLTTYAETKNMSVSDAIAKFLKSDVQGKKDPEESAVCLVDTGLLKSLTSFAHCKVHRTPLTATVSTTGPIANVSLKCQQGYNTVHWCSSPEVSGYARRKESRYQLTNQLVFSFVSCHLRYEEFSKVCQALRIAGVTKTLFYSISKKAFEAIEPLVQKQLALARVFIILSTPCRILLTDATFSQRRDGNYCTTPFIVEGLYLTIHIEVGGKKSEGLKASELEAHLTKRGLQKLSEEKFPLLQLVHDEHSEVTKWASTELIKLFGKDARQTHDFWHKEKSLEKK